MADRGHECDGGRGVGVVGGTKDGEEQAAGGVARGRGQGAAAEDATQGEDVGGRGDEGEDRCVGGFCRIIRSEFREDAFCRCAGGGGG